MNIIVATDEEGGIGKDEKIPWNHKEDMQFFRMITYGTSVIMGRKTMESIGRPLEGRKNFVVTSQIPKEEVKFDNRSFSYSKPTEIDGFIFCPSIISAVTEALKFNTCDMIFFIGGQSIYEESSEFVNTIYLTRIPNRYNCDRFFVLPQDFVRVAKINIGELIFEKYRRNNVRSS